MIGLIFDDSPHYLDHLGPLCALLQVPLVIFEPAIADLARRYYPDLKVVEEDLRTWEPPQRVITCSPRPLLEASLYRCPKETVWIPHGQSDKAPCFEVLQEETAVAVYGERMENQVRAAHPTLPIHRLGNFRYRYFLAHQSFYKGLLPQTKRNFLYAPTWDDYEKSNSFWNAFPVLAQTLPRDATLLVKLHPNTYRQYPEKVEVLRGRYGQKENIVWIEDFPPIYPLLSISDAYIGDMSSIGYDFLTWNRPLFLLEKKRELCGRHVKPEEVFQAYEEPDLFAPQRAALYDQTFDPNPGHLQITW